MTSPIDIDALTETFVVNPKTDFMMTENEPQQSTTKATISKIQAIDAQDQPPFPTGPFVSGDVFAIQEEISGDRKAVNYQDITFPVGTKIWVYRNTAPFGWKSIGAGDCLLALKGTSAPYNVAGVTTNSSNWTGTGVALTIEQIPGHTHVTQKDNHASSSIDVRPARKGKTVEDDAVEAKRYCFTELAGGGQAHDHGNAWRPLAYVGLLIEKL